MVADDALIALGWRVAILASLVVSVLVAWWLADPEGRWGAVLRSRFVLGVPWGSLVSLTGVLAVYLFVQGGYRHWHQPVTIAFTASSYFYPLGLIAAAFSHAGPSHLLGNLTAALILAPLAEYVWGHYPRERGSQSFGSTLTNPWVRALVLFPLGVFVVGVFSSLLAWGPVIGFSGVVFAFAGFALVRYPLATVVALAARSAVRVIRDALFDPVTVTEATVGFSRPWWHGIAVQGHALGLFLGIGLGALLLWHRDERPDPFRLWLGSLLAGMSLALWAIWWVRGSETFVLFRGLGVVLVFAFATLVTAALLASDRPLWGERSPTRRQTAAIALFVPLLVMGLVAIPLNLNVVEATEYDETVTVGDYTVFYDEDVENEMISVIDVSLLGETTTVETSGVIVVSEERHVWRRTASKGRLAVTGHEAIHVGGPGWRETVHVYRQGWEVAGNETVYAVWMEHRDERVHAFDSRSLRAEPVVDGREIHLVSDGGTFYVRVEGDESVDRAPVPLPQRSVTVGEITVVREEGKLIAVSGDTRVPIAEEETYH